MIIHNQTFTPSDVTRLVIEYTGPNGPGLLDLTGPAAAAAMRDIARHRSSGGKSGRPRADVRDAASLPARILRYVETTHPATVRGAAEAVGCAQSRAYTILTRLVEDGEIVEGEGLGRAFAKTYRVANATTEGAAP